MKVERLSAEYEIPEGVNVTLGEKSLISLKGKNGEVERSFFHPKVKLELKDGKIEIYAKDATKREKTQVHTFMAHFKNLCKGVVEGHEYKLKICSGHFPMNVTLKNNVLSVKNFLGEKVPRDLKIKSGADVKIEGDFIIIKSTNKELAGTIAGDMERLCRITNRDRRIFQDGIYIIMKDGKGV